MKPKKCGWSIAELFETLHTNNQKLMELQKTQQIIRCKILETINETWKMKTCNA